MFRVAKSSYFRAVHVHVHEVIWHFIGLSAEILSRKETLEMCNLAHLLEALACKSYYCVILPLRIVFAVHVNVYLRLCLLS